MRKMLTAAAALVLLASPAYSASSLAARDLVKNQKFQSDNPQFLPAVRKLIALRGFVCPRLTNLWTEGMTPYGEKLEALCGPDDKSGLASPSLHYAVYPEKQRVKACKPLGMSFEDCA